MASHGFIEVSIPRSKFSYDTNYNYWKAKDEDTFKTMDHQI